MSAGKILSALVLATIATGTQAAPLTNQQIFEQFNLVVFNNSNSSSHVDGRSFIGGNLSGGDYVQHPGAVAPSSYTGLTILGNASGNIHVNGLGAVVAGNASNLTVNTGDAVVLGNATNSSFNGSGNYYVGGCTPIWLGVPDGPLGFDGRPAAWRASLFHDALCQFRGEIPGLTAAAATSVFSSLLAADGAPLWMQRLYPAAVLRFGPQDFMGGAAR